jgi:hypothetical protein
MIPTLVTLYGDDPQDIARAWPGLSAAHRREALSSGLAPMGFWVTAAVTAAKIGAKIGKGIAKRVRSKRKAKKQAAAARVAAARVVVPVSVVTQSRGGVPLPRGSAALPVTVTPQAKQYLIYGGLALAALLLLRRG